MHKSGPKQVASLAASPLVASTLEPAPQPQLSDSLAFDAWSNQACPALSQCPGAETWVTPGLCRMDSVDQLRSWTSDMLAQMSTTGLAIMFDERKNMVKGQSFHIHDSGNAVKPEEGNTECWLWHATMGKRKLFAGILKHSKYPLTPRFLRISLRYHGHVEAQRTIRAHAHQVRFVLEGSGASTSSCEELRHSQDQGGVADRTAGDTSGHLDTGDPHDFECERTQAPLPNSPRVPACPCTRLSQLRVAELQTMCAQHNLITSPATRSGEMQLMLRMHWEEQCQLAEGVLFQQMTPAVTPSTATTKPTAPPGLSPMMEPVNVPVPMGKSSKRSSQEEDNWDVLSDVEGGNEEVMRQIREAEAAAQEALTRAATLRDAHCLPPKNRVAPMPKAKIPPAHSR